MLHTVSLWEMGRSVESGQIAWMNPLERGLRGSALGPVGVACEALQAVAQFGIWFELHQMRNLMNTQFHERRHAWLNDIADQWIAEHRGCTGLRLDTTEALASEAQKFFDVYVDDPTIDVPEILSLKIRRIGDYLDRVYSIHALAHNTAVTCSKSSDKWSLEEKCDSRQFVLDTLVEQGEEAEAKWQSDKGSGWNLAKTLIPWVGPLFEGGAGGNLYSSWKNVRQSRKHIARARNVPDLLRIRVCMEGVQGVVGSVDDFMLRHQLPLGTVLSLRGDGVGTTLCLRDPSAWRRFKRYFTGEQLLKPLPSPTNTSLN